MFGQPTSTFEDLKKQLRALIQIENGTVTIFPLVDNDHDERLVLNALRFLREGDD